MLALILENESQKLLAILTQYKLMYDQPFYATKWETDALAFIRSRCEEMTLYVDYELDPGCGDGISFLRDALSEKHMWIEKVVITSQSPDAQREMQEQCRLSGIPYEIVRFR